MDDSYELIVPLCWFEEDVTYRQVKDWSYSKSLEEHETFKKKEIIDKVRQYSGDVEELEKILIFIKENGISGSTTYNEIVTLIEEKWL